MFEELFSFACPKFLSPVVPNYDNVHPNYHKEPFQQQLKVFAEEVQQQAQLSTIRRYCRLLLLLLPLSVICLLVLPLSAFLLSAGTAFICVSVIGSLCLYPRLLSAGSAFIHVQLSIDAVIFNEPHSAAVDGGTRAVSPFPHSQALSTDTGL